MKKDLTNSNIDRQNILNNKFALDEIQNVTNIKGIDFEGKIRFTKDMVANFFEVDIRTIERYSADFSDELKRNGYEIIKGKRLQQFKEQIKGQNVPDINVGNMTPQLAIFDFRAFLNIGMLLVESENARVLRQAILDIVIDTINQKTGGATKYINQRDEDFIGSWMQEENYRKQFTDALKHCVDMNQFKYALYTDKIYQSIFKEKAKEYRLILNLKEKDKTRDTFYSEILDLISSYEYGLANIIIKEFEKLGRKLSTWEVNNIFKEFEELPHWKPLLDKARNKMASRDLAFRDALHLQLQDYITPLNIKEYERFLGEKSKELSERLDDASDALKRLKERG